MVLDPEERHYADKRMVLDAAANVDSTGRLSRRDIIEAFKDWKMWSMLPMQHLRYARPAGSSISFPVVLKGRVDHYLYTYADDLDGPRARERLLSSSRPIYGRPPCVSACLPATFEHQESGSSTSSYSRTSPFRPVVLRAGLIAFYAPLHSSPDRR
ncbi:hypothetical protein CALVIDRAFT_561350 [Calocera viscosa TUFC12733]|uniref:Uncharacterized protein n=1 Tax=Calocera viscosa (strain TUFC12733) TaxID=1330018 RepID=A0A167Q7F9_CALVF|nr:hypothetical protein CALVIDRAFT_561350 [Calocera viscosa TUFC12733]